MCARVCGGEGVGRAPKCLCSEQEMQEQEMEER